MSLVLRNSFGLRRWAKNTQNQIGICAFLIAVRTRQCSKVAWQNSDFQLRVRDWRLHEVHLTKTSCFPTVVKALCQTNTTIIQQWKPLNYTWTTRRDFIDIQTQNNQWKINKKTFKRVFRVVKSVRNGMWFLQEIKISWATGYDFGNERVSRQIHFVWDNVFWTKLKLKAKFCLQGVIMLLREAVLL